MSSLKPKTPPSPPEKSHLFRRLTSARVLGHPLVWSAMTGLFILIGYLWLQYYAKPLSDSIKSEREASEIIGARAKQWDPSIYKTIESKDQMQITQLEDQFRADDYRLSIDQENKIRPMLLNARDLMQQEIYVDKKGGSNNAWQVYADILKADAQNTFAQSGQRQILSILQNNAQTATEAKQYEQAELWLNKLDLIDSQKNKPAKQLASQLDNLSDDPLNIPSFQQTTRNLIAKQISDDLAKTEAAQRKSERRKQLKAALNEAQTALETSPPQLLIAYDLFQRAAKLDESNKKAQQGLLDIQGIRAERAETAILKGDFEQAQQELDRLDKSEASATTTSALQEKLDIAKKSTLLIKLQQASIASQELPVLKTPLPLLIENAPDENQTPISDQFTRADDANSIDVPLNSAGSLLPKSPPIEEITTTNIAIISPALPTLDISNNQTSKTALSPELQLKKGIQAYYSGQYESAFNLLYPLAEADNAQAQFRLGIMYLQGRTVVKNEDLAKQWITRALPNVLRAAQKDEAWAQADLGTGYELGIGLKADVKHAASWYQKAAKQGDTGAQANLGVLYASGEGVPYDRQLALYWLKKAALGGNNIAKENLGILNAR